MLGVLVNTAAVVVGGVVGLVVNKGLPKRFTDAIMIGLGLCTIYIGISGVLEGENKLILALSIVLGVAVGTALRIDDRLRALGEKLDKRFASKDGRSIAQGFVTGSLLFCVGAMAVIGSINSGIRGDNTMLFTKSVLDLIAAAMLAASLGGGVILSAASIFVYQGLLVLLSQLLRPLIEQPAMLAEMTSAGSLIIIALGLNLIGVTKIKVADFLPAIIFAPAITALAGVLGV
ncbi:MAG: DUF554 domain-containing protein [Oscillospiraceae bacterium]|nr:DUF554 domain-containing protein [Oscillospiraceae bacterium]